MVSVDDALPGSFVRVAERGNQIAFWAKGSMKVLVSSTKFQTRPLAASKTTVALCFVEALCVGMYQMTSTHGCDHAKCAILEYRVLVIYLDVFE